MTETKIDDEIEFTILSITEIGQSLQVTVETEYGIKQMGFSINKRYLNPKTGKPQFFGELKRKLEAMYGTRDPITKIVPEKQLYKDLIGKKTKLKDIDKLETNEK